MLSAIKPKLNPVILFFAKPLKSIDPNILTFLGLLPPIIFLWLMLSGHYLWALVSFLGLFFDTLDGAVARLSGKVSSFGAVLDSTFDRIADAIYIYAFVFAGLVRPELGFTVLLVSFLISYIRSRVELAGFGKFKLDVGLIERPERLILLFVALLSVRFLPGIFILGMNSAELIFVVLIILSLFTVGQRLLKAKELLVT
jgi:archaetidylinositol phosphate synthase